MQAIAKYEVNGTALEITPDVVLQYMVDPAKVCDRNGNCTIPPREMMRVIMTLQERKLNPFTGDVIIQPRTDKYTGNTTCTLVVTKDFYSRRAAESPLYDGKESGIVVLTGDGQVMYRPGSAVFKSIGEKLLGGWCRVHIKGRSVPEYAEVSLEEYDQSQALWKTKPATMIQKVAISQALRAAFPDQFNGTYEREEVGYEEAQQTPVQAMPVQAMAEEALPWGEPVDQFEESIKPFNQPKQEATYEKEF